MVTTLVLEDVASRLPNEFRVQRHQQDLQNHEFSRTHLHNRSSKSSTRSKKDLRYWL
jgi:hypothetical protein